jgi:hypothetical protein
MARQAQQDDPIPSTRKLVIEVEIANHEGDGCDDWDVLDAVYHVGGVVSCAAMEYDGHGGFDVLESTRRGPYTEHE